MKPFYPSADAIAVAVVAACRETGGDPEGMVQGMKCLGGPKGEYATSRARAYAAEALVSFYECGPVAISRLLGHQSPSCHLSALAQQRRKGKLTWWDERIKGRVTAALTRHLREKEGLGSLKLVDDLQGLFRRKGTGGLDVTAAVLGDPQ